MQKTFRAVPAGDNLPGGSAQCRLKQYDDQRFLRLVERELRNKISDSEKAYLCSSPEMLALWDDALVLLLTEAQNNLSSINQQILKEKQEYLARGHEAKSAWFARKAELEKKRASTSRFRGVVQKRRFLVKQLRVELFGNRQQAGEGADQEMVLRGRQDIRKGYRMAVDHVQALVERGISFRLALEIITVYEQQFMSVWGEYPAASDDPQPHFLAFVDTFLHSHG